MNVYARVRPGRLRGVVEDVSRAVNCAPLSPQNGHSKPSSGHPETPKERSNRNRAKRSNLVTDEESEGCNQNLMVEAAGIEAESAPKCPYCSNGHSRSLSSQPGPNPSHELDFHPPSSDASPPSRTLTTLSVSGKSHPAAPNSRPKIPPIFPTISSGEKLPSDLQELVANWDILTPTFKFEILRFVSEFTKGEFRHG